MLIKQRYLWPELLKLREEQRQPSLTYFSVSLLSFTKILHGIYHIRGDLHRLLYNAICENLH
jgi:hypothetical protein